MGWRSLRDGLLGDPAVRARIGRWPVGRWIAARHARRLFDVVAGFAQTQLLLAAVELGVFAQLSDGPRPWDEVVDLPPRGQRALLQGLIATGLVEHRGNRTALTVAGLVVASDPGLRAMIEHNRLLYGDLAEPAALLAGDRVGAVARFWPYAGAESAAPGYSALMAASQAMVVEEVLRAIDWSRRRHVIDVGGGDGTFLRTLRAHRAHLALTLVDLPAVVAGLDLSAERIAVHGLAPDAPLPHGGDTVTLLRLLHDLDDDAAAALLTRAAAGLPARGRVVVAEPMAKAGRDPQTAYFAAYFAAMRSGRLRSAKEVKALLREAGFGAVRIAAETALVTVIVANRLY